MTLREKLSVLYPDLSFKDFELYIVLQNDSDGKGDYIAKWEHESFPKPTQKMLDEVK